MIENAKEIPEVLIDLEIEIENVAGISRSSNNNNNNNKKIEESRISASVCREGTEIEMLMQRATEDP
jgi:hypothetical protein